jgi:hypothetical protein
MNCGQSITKFNHEPFPTIASMPARRIVLYDTTLRDGAQMQGVDFRYYVSTATDGIWLVLLGGSCEEE